MSHIDWLYSLAGYLWLYLVERLGWRWWGIALGAFALCVAAWFVVGRRRGVDAKKFVAWGLMLSYLVVLFATTVITRPSRAASGLTLNLLPKLRVVFVEGRFDPEVLANLLMLLPVGFLLPIATDMGALPTLLACLAITTSVEMMQLAFARGWFEVADIVLNVLGAAVGYALWTMFRMLQAHRLRT